jgi:hypothetical protein
MVIHSANRSIIHFTTRRGFIIGGMAVAFLSDTPKTVLSGEIDAPSAPFEVSIPVESLSNGPVSANGFAGFTNSTGQVFTSSSWGAAKKRYLKADDYKEFVATTTTTTRDVELTSWGANITMFLRLSDGRGYYFAWNYDVPSAGQLRIGIVTGLTEGQEFEQNGTYYNIWNAKLSDVASSYNPSDTSRDLFTFGASGFDIYLRYNGIELVRLKEYRHMEAGLVSLQANRGHGFRNIGVRYLPPKTLFSIPEVDLIDLRDFGLRGAATTGSIDADSNSLTIAEDKYFRIGDRIIVEVGGENGGGLRGTIGVGGTYPNLNYANAAEMNADTGRPNLTYAWMRDTGDVRSSYGGKWNQDGRYYLQKIAPKALLAKITAISNDGLNLTLDARARVAATDANVYLDNIGYFAICGEAAVGPPAPDNIRIKLPAGRFAVSGYVSIKAKTGWQIFGQGKTETEVFSPKGCRSATIEAFQSDYTVVRDLHLHGNARNHGYGLDWVGDTVSTFPYGIHFNLCQHCVAQDCKVTDAFMKSVGAAYAKDCWARRIEVISTEAFQCYIQWLIAWSDSQLGGVEDCTIDSPYLTAGLEMFRSSGVIFRRVKTRNATFSSNSSGGNFLFEDCAIMIEANSQMSEPSFSHHNPIININSNIRPPNEDMALGGRIVRQTITVKGYINSNHDNLIYCVINAENPNIIIEGTYPDAENPKGFFSGPGWHVGTNGFNGIFVRSAGRNVTIRGMRFKGATDWLHGHGPVHTEGGSCRVLDCVMDRPATGKYVTEKGTQTNADWEALH